MSKLLTTLLFLLISFPAKALTVTNKTAYIIHLELLRNGEIWALHCIDLGPGEIYKHDIPASEINYKYFYRLRVDDGVIFPTIGFGSIKVGPYKFYVQKNDHDTESKYKYNLFSS